MRFRNIWNILFRKLTYFLSHEGGIIEYELLYGEVWNSVKGGIRWLNNIESLSLFPGRWAIGYNTMYVLVRTLNDISPHNVLEFGLGNSSKIISQYFAAQDKGVWHHIIIEHNTKWINFIKKENILSRYSKIHQTQLITKKYKRHKVISYKNINPVMNLKYDLILIDGPLGSEGAFSRVDILSYIPGCLNESFAIIIDDYHRRGERGLVRELESILRRHKIDFATGIYLGEAECFIIVSKNLLFLTTL